MKLKLFLIGMSLLLISAHSPQAASDGQSALETSISITAEIWCPYACTPESENPGILVEVVREIFRQQGIEVEYGLMPWRRALMETEKGTSDLVLGVVTGNRGSLLLDKRGMGVDETIVVVRKDSDFDYQGPESLNSMRLGVIANYTYDSNGVLDSYLKERRRLHDRIVVIYRDEPIKSLANMLSGYRIDAFLENRQVTLYEGKRMNFGDKIRIISTGLGDTVHVGFTPNDRGRRNLDIYNRGLTRLLESGKVDEIVKKYGLDGVPAEIKVKVNNPSK
jgi:polar amino acid transport system substrate-binding protein